MHCSSTDRTAVAVILVGGALASCGGSGGSGPGGGGGGPGSGRFGVADIDNGNGPILPHTIRRLDDDGDPTGEIVSITREQDLLDHLRPENPVLPPTRFSAQAVLPTGAPGNHFLVVRFTSAVDPASIFDSQAAGTSGLTGTIAVLAEDPVSGEAFPLAGRAFLDGATPVLRPSAGRLEMQRWVELAGEATRAVDVDGARPGQGFPGTGSTFEGSARLVAPASFVFVADSDGDLSTFETFPAGKQIAVRVGTGVRSLAGDALESPALASTTVGADVLRPEVASSPAPEARPQVTPGSGETDVDPLAPVLVRFSEPVQPLSVGPLDDGSIPGLSSALHLSFGPDDSRTQMPFTVRVPSVLDLSTFELVPAFHFPGSGPGGLECAAFDRVDVEVFAGQVSDLAEPANANLLGIETHFFTGAGPGVVNAPVAPDTILVGRQGAQPGVSVIDLNGNGGSTGNPAYDPTLSTFEKGDTLYPLNPNVREQGAFLLPPLEPGTCTIDGGSAGVFTLTKDSNLVDLVVRAPLLLSVDDMMLGHALDGTFNNAPAPFGCQAGGGNLCASTGQKLIDVMVNGNTVVPSIVSGFTGGHQLRGYENVISIAPHPNPPPLRFPPLCISPSIGAQEPTSIDSIISFGLRNRLQPGYSPGDPAAGLPPSGVLASEQNSFFVGPSMPPQSTASCWDYHVRQQVGHFLYVIDRARSEITVLNSNRMTVVDRIVLADPTDLAMAPGLSTLAVTNQAAGSVSFLDIDPSSGTFHQVVKSTTVGAGPRGIAWQPDGEDVLVCNEAAGTVSILSAASLEVRHTVASQLSRPFDVAITPRQQTHGHLRDVYFAYVLDRAGKVALFESGPNGVNGWGYDDVIGVAPFDFHQPKAIQPDPLDLRSAVWIAHEGRIDLSTGAAGPAGEGALSKLAIESALPGRIPLSVASFLLPNLRSMELVVAASIGPERLSGIPVDLAFDDLVNLGALPDVVSDFSASAGRPGNGKNLIRNQPPLASRATKSPAYLFAAIPSPRAGTGVVDVFRLGSGLLRTDTDPWVEGVQSISAPAVQRLVDYWRQ